MRPARRKPKTPKVFPVGEPGAPWMASAGMLIAGRAVLDGLDALAIEMEARWGADRLRLLVDAPLRERFDRQRYLTNQAVWYGDLEAVRQQGPRMMAAWRALDRVATEAGATKLNPEHWEITLADGSVAVLVPSTEHMAAVLQTAEGRSLRVYTLDEIAHLIDAFPEVSRAKETIPGMVVTSGRQKSVADPLFGVHDTSVPIDEPMNNRFNDVIPF